MDATFVERLHNKQLYVTCDEKCYLIIGDRISEVINLESGQKEADTPLFLHAAHDGCIAVVKSAEDTDVFAFCVAFSNVILCPLYQRQSTKTRTRFINIQKVVSVYDVDTCEVILEVHAITGCDCASSFAGKGKLIALKLSEKSWGKISAYHLNYTRGWNHSCVYCMDVRMAQLTYTYYVTICSVIRKEKLNHISYFHVRMLCKST